MTWFVIYLAVNFGLGACVSIAKANGWKPSPPGAGMHALVAIDVLMVVGILVWLL